MNGLMLDSVWRRSCMPRYSKEQGLCSHNFSPANVKAFVKLAFLFAGSEWEFVMHCSTGSRCTKLFPPLLRSHFSRAEFTASRNLFKIWPLAAIQFLLEDQSNVYVLELTGTMASSESRTSSTCKSSLVASLCDLGFALLFIAPFLVTRSPRLLPTPKCSAAGRANNERMLLV